MGSGAANLLGYLEFQDDRSHLEIQLVVVDQMVEPIWHEHDLVLRLGIGRRPHDLYMDLANNIYLDNFIDRTFLYSQDALLYDFSLHPCKKNHFLNCMAYML